MRFRTVVLLSALAIAPVCAERIKVSNERHVIDSMLSVDGVVAAACAPAARVAAARVAAAAVAVKEGGGQWGSGGGGELVEGASGEEGPAQGGKSRKLSSPSRSVPHITAAH